MDYILNSIDDIEDDKVSLQQIMSLNPVTLTIDNPLTFLLYLDYNPNLEEKERNTVIKIIEKLKRNKQMIDDYNLKKFDVL